jgi:hypothetical protein
MIIPRSEILLEAFMRLYARDKGKRIGSFGFTMIAYIELYVDEDGYLDVDRLAEPFRTLYGDLKERSKPLRQWTKDLKETLGIPEGEDEDCCAWGGQLM